MPQIDAKIFSDFLFEIRNFWKDKSFEKEHIIQRGSGLRDTFESFMDEIYFRIPQNMQTFYFFNIFIF